MFGVKSAINRLFTQNVLARKVRILAATVAFFSVLGPFGTYEAFDLVGRIGYWATQLILCGFIFHVSIDTCLQSHKLTRSWTRLFRLIIGVLIGTFLAVWVAIVVQSVAAGVLAFSTLPWMFICVFAVGLVIGFVNFMPPFVRVATSQHMTDIDFDYIQFYRENCNLKGNRIRWITMEDHYAKIVLDGKEVSIHSTMSDLEQQLVHYPGLRIHRSHWIAYESILAITRIGRRMEISVGPNTRLPIGGSYQKNVERVFAEIRKPVPKAPLDEV